MAPPRTLTLAVRALAAVREGQAADRLRELALSERTYTTSCRTRGEAHPDTLICMVNLARDLTGRDDRRQREILDRAVAGLVAALGPDHPVTTAARAGERLECDVEPPPT